MSTYVLMRILESAPKRYDAGIGLLTLGAVGRAYDRLVSRIPEGARVIDIGCGTGALTLRAARRGACVKGIDVNPEMLERARERVRAAGLEARVELVEMGVAELDREERESYDVVVSGLCFSELSPDEQRYALRQVARLLRADGLLLVADEVRPSGPVARAAQRLLRAPLVAITYLITQQTTHPVSGLPERIAESGLRIESQRSSALGGFIEIVARRAGAGPG
ncbi:MAG: corrinoid protein-associated methyltransferase CpaM [Myxococcota bacterium]